jgi:protein-tyrosine phosphatase
MKFFVHSRPVIELMDFPEVPHAIISVTTPGDLNAVRLHTNSHTLGVLSLSFYDTDNHVVYADSGRRFSIADADQILNFVGTHAKIVEEVHVHCDAGWSRSPAIAAALSKIYLNDDAEYFRRYSPNMRVYGGIINAYSWRQRETQ